jgi:hypothetical protein
MTGRFPRISVSRHPPPPSSQSPARWACRPIRSRPASTRSTPRRSRSPTCGPPDGRALHRGPVGDVPLRPAARRTRAPAAAVRKGRDRRPRHRARRARDHRPHLRRLHVPGRCARRVPDRAAQRRPGRRHPQGRRGRAVPQRPQLRRPGHLPQQRREGEGPRLRQQPLAAGVAVAPHAQGRDGSFRRLRQRRAHRQRRRRGIPRRPCSRPRPSASSQSRNS